MDVAVVGAGPAGAFCAERLARAGHRVSVYDPSHPREKPCGGGVTPGAFQRHPELRELRAHARPAHRVRLRAPSGRVVGVALAQPIDVFPRRVLDALLLERARKAGARLEPLRVRRVRADADGARLETSAGERRHDAVVGADGAASIVRRSLLGRRPGSRAGYATAGFHVEGLAEDELYVEFVPEYAGYLWVFPRPGHASVGIAAPLARENGRRLRERVLRLLEQRYPGSLDLPRTPYAASIPCPTAREARRQRPGPGGPRFVLVGDAANAVDGITGEGIQHALASAVLAADALDAAGPVEGPRLYARRWARGPGREIAISARWAARWYRPASVELALALAARSRRARRIVADLLMVVQPYSTLRRRALHDAVRPVYGEERA